MNVYDMTQGGTRGPVNEWCLTVTMDYLQFMEGETSDACRMCEVCIVTYDNPGLIIGDNEDVWPRNSQVRFFL